MSDKEPKATENSAAPAATSAPTNAGDGLGVWGMGVLERNMDPREKDALSHISFGTDPRLTDLQKRFLLFWQASPTLKSIVLEATAAGDIDVCFHRDVPIAAWAADERRILLQPNTSEPLEISLVFEIVNASRDEEFATAFDGVAEGQYESGDLAKEPWSAAFEATPEDLPALLFARAIERIEWASARQFQTILEEVTSMGIELPQGGNYQRKFKEEDSNKSRWWDTTTWDAFESYFLDQWDLEHTQAYIRRYEILMGKLAESAEAAVRAHSAYDFSDRYNRSLAGRVARAEGLWASLDSIPADRKNWFARACMINSGSRKND